MKIALERGTMARKPIAELSFSQIYPLLVNKAVKKGRTEQEVRQVICWLTGEKIEKALAFTATLDKRLESGAPIPVEDNAAMLLRMSSGAIGTLLVSWTSYGCEDNATVLNCTGGVIRLHGPCAALEVVRSDGTLLDCESELQRLENETNGTGIIDLFVQGIKTGVSPIPAQEALQVLEAVENALS